MHVAILRSRKSRRLASGALVLMLGLWQSSAIAQLNVYTVGAAGSCDYNSLREAISVASAQVGGIAELRISFPTITSLGYSFAGNNSEVKIENPQADIRIYGGYASCSEPLPTAGNFTTFTYNNSVADAPHSLLSISNSYTSGTRRRVTLAQIRMRGAFDGSLGGPTFGGGLSISGNTELVLDDSTVNGFNAGNGGGISVANLSPVDPSLYPSVALFNNSAVDENTANNGGGIYALLGRVRLSASSVSDNAASQNGGGIYILDLEDAGDFGSSSNRALQIRGGSTGTFGNSISGNSAGSAVFSSTSGFGGGIFSRYGHVEILTQAGGFSGSNNQLFADNQANFGGAIYMEGSSQPAGGPFAVLRSASGYFGFNTARSRGGAVYLKNAVDATISGNSGPCGFGLFQRALCSEFAGNVAEGTDGAGFQDRGGAIFLLNERVDGASRPIVRVYRNLFNGNSDPDGGAAVAASGGAGAGVGSRMIFNRNIFINNAASTGNSALISNLNGVDLNFRYNTVLDSNTSTRMFYMDGGELDVTGSILWGTPDRTTPFHFVWFPENDATMVHAGCLVIRASDEGTAGVPNPELLQPGYPPNLDARYAPRGGSNAIDHCDDLGGAPPADAYGNGIYDTPGIAQRYGNNDLGAVEQTDIIFANMFGSRPEN